VRYSLVLRFTGSESVAVLRELPIPVYLKNLLQCLLNEAIDYTIDASRSFVLHLDDIGLCDHLPARPSTAAFYPIPVRQIADLLNASFRLCLTTLPLHFATLHRHQVV
jgi:hypothetical protein